MTAQVAAAIWVGALLGISFLATPIKFRAQTMPYHAALELGQRTFRAFAPVEWGLLAAVALLGEVWQPAPVRLVAPLALLTGLLVVQHAWVRRDLNARVDRVLRTLERPRRTGIHRVYIAAEVAKVAALLAIATG